jgi:hypothetical protein
MILTVHNRVTLLNVLPEKGDFSTLKIVRKLREDLSFSEDELKVLCLTQCDNRITWKTDCDPEKDVAIGEKATDIIICALKALDDKKELTQQHFDLYEKFCCS